jgi:hypothetical protein
MRWFYLVTAFLLISFARASYADPAADKLSTDMLIRAGVPRAEAEASRDWVHCTEHAVDIFYGQPESADTIVVAAMAACLKEENKYRNTMGSDIGTSVSSDNIETAGKPALLARVLALRALRHK